MKSGKIWVFDENRLHDALAEYERESIEAYPQHEEKIRITIKAVNDFLNSDHANILTMKGEGEA